VRQRFARHVLRSLLGIQSHHQALLLINVPSLKVASVDTLDGFLRELRTRYPESSAISPAGAKGEGVSAPGAAPDKLNASAAKTTEPDPAGKGGPPVRDAGSSPLPPKPPAGVPVKPDKEPTGSIPRLQKSYVLTR
jgi:hypothetical protein